MEHPGAYELNYRGCNVVAGRWNGPYTGGGLTNPSNVHIDHVVPLAKAQRSGEASWSRAR